MIHIEIWIIYPADAEEEGKVIMGKSMDFCLNLKSLMNNLLSISNFLDLDEVDEIKEFIDLSEHEIALMTYVGICRENKKLPIDAQYKPLIDELALLMKLSERERFAFIQNSINELVYK